MTHAVWAALRRLEQAHETVRPADVVKAARPPGSPLHDLFEWNDGKAATEYRLSQARKLLQAFVLYAPGTRQEMRGFVSLTEDRQEGNGYRSTEAVLGDQTLRGQLERQGYRELAAFARSFRTRFGRLEVFTPIVEAIEQFVTEGNHKAAS